ncbi:MAG: hypothetical protein H7255_04050 [Ramlibacter sp.]|nr:hypothetical protein [Ramlibacter sp.]
MNAGVVGAAGSLARNCVRIALPVALCVLAFDAAAQLAPTQDKARPQLEISSVQTPRFDNIDGALRASRMDMTLLSPGRTAIGPSVGVTSLDGPNFNSTGFASAAPSVDLGVHFRHTTEDNYRVDVHAWRRVPQNDALSQIQTREATYGARVEMQISQVPKPGFIADHGIGLQLESGARITLRRSAGKPMMFYRAKF